MQIRSKERVKELGEVFTARREVEEVLGAIKKFKANAGEKKETKIDLIEAAKKVRQIERSAVKGEKVVDAEEKERIRELKKEQERLRGLISTLVKRIPVFLYITDAEEASYRHIVKTDREDIFRLVTGIEIEEFVFLEEVGLMRLQGVTDLIGRFRRKEQASITFMERFLDR